MRTTSRRHSSYGFQNLALKLAVLSGSAPEVTSYDIKECIARLEDSDLCFHQVVRKNGLVHIRPGPEKIELLKPDLFLNKTVARTYDYRLFESLTGQTASIHDVLSQLDVERSILPKETIENLLEDVLTQILVDLRTWSIFLDRYLTQAEKEGGISSGRPELKIDIKLAAEYLTRWLGGMNKMIESQERFDSLRRIRSLRKAVNKLQNLIKDVVVYIGKIYSKYPLSDEGEHDDSFGRLSRSRDHLKAGKTIRLRFGTSVLSRLMGVDKEFQPLFVAHVKVFGQKLSVSNDIVYHEDKPLACGRRTNAVMENILTNPRFYKEARQCCRMFGLVPDTRQITLGGYYGIPFCGEWITMHAVRGAVEMDKIRESEKPAVYTNAWMNFLTARLVHLVFEKIVGNLSPSREDFVKLISPETLEGFRRENANLHENEKIITFLQSYFDSLISSSTSKTPEILGEFHPVCLSVVGAIAENVAQELSMFNTEAGCMKSAYNLHMGIADILYSLSRTRSKFLGPGLFCHKSFGDWKYKLKMIMQLERE